MQCTTSAAYPSTLQHFDRETRTVNLSQTQTEHVTLAHTPSAAGLETCQDGTHANTLLRDGTLYDGLRRRRHQDRPLSHFFASVLSSVASHPCPQVEVSTRRASLALSSITRGSHSTAPPCGARVLQYVMPLILVEHAFSDMHLRCFRTTMVQRSGSDSAFLGNRFELTFLYYSSRGYSSRGQPADLQISDVALS